MGSRESLLASLAFCLLPLNLLPPTFSNWFKLECSDTKKETVINVTVTEKTVEVNGLSWFYREAQPNNGSEQPPLLLLHGLPSQSLSWGDLMPMLTESGLSAIAPDWIGFGSSAKPDQRDFAYTPAAYLKALSEFINTLDLDKIHLVVQGFLGSVGLQYALENPDRIERTVILNTPLSPKDKLPWQLRQIAIPFVGDMVTQDPLLTERALEKGSGYEISEKNLAIYRQPFLKSSAAGRSLLSAVKKLQIPQAIGEVASGLSTWNKQTLIIWGMADLWLDYSPVSILAKRPNFELLQLKEAKHYPQEHWSEEISTPLIQFLRRQAV
jgi:pimeloyl-ACP methyl ester carboxylesterase